MVGDLGVLYRAHDTAEERPVVMLLLPDQLAADGQLVSRLSRSQQAVAALGEPGLVPYEYGGLAEGQLYLVRHEIEGRSLADLVGRGRIEAGAAAAIAAALGDLVAILHRAGMVHGGLSPHAVYVRFDGTVPEVSIVDCGVLPILREVQAPPGGPWGRPPFLSPEQAAGERATPASDVYLLGSLLYALLAGRAPFRSDDETILILQHLRQQPPALEVLLPDVPPFLAQIIDTALAKEPAARYRHAGQFAEILRSRSAVAGIVLPRETETPPRQEMDAALHVPAPPVQVTYAATEEEGEGWGEGLDWIMLALAVAALLAVLGLIPLWRTVAERYTTPLVAPAPGSERHPCLWEMSQRGLCADAVCRATAQSQARALYPPPTLSETGSELVDGTFSGIMARRMARQRGVREFGLVESRLRV
jgi:serine/threonine-protein kinase